MIMSSEPENFESLRRLLAIKRHEQPPPGYFHDFSRQVIVRIQAGEGQASESFLARILRPVSWAQSVWSDFEGKPILAGAFGVGVCSLLVVGLVSSPRMDADANGLTATPVAAPISPANVPSQIGGSTLFDRSGVDRVATGLVYSTESPSSSIFDEIRLPHLQPSVRPVNYSPGH